MLENNFSFKKSATAAIVTSELMTGREKIKTEELIEKYPQGVTITAFDVVQGEKEYPVFTFAEDNTKFFTGGTVLKKIVAMWLKPFNGDTDAANEAYEQSGERVIFKLYKRTSKTGMTYTAVDVK